jgi:hypothetical protein
LTYRRDWLRDAWMLSVVPALPVHCPWPAAYACYRAFARQRTCFGEAAAPATVAADYLPVGDIDAFLHDVRTAVLLDVADLELSRRKPVEWWPRHVDVVGAWPDTRAFVAVTFHYGTGLWLCRALRRAGHRSTFLSARFEREAFPSRPRLYRYGMRRLAEVERLCGAPVTYRPGASDALLDALDRGVSVIGLIDIPPRLAPRGQRPVTLLGHSASLPDGLLRLADKAGVPIVPCWVEIDFETGRRRVVIGEARAPAPFDATLADFAATLDRLVRHAPAAWMFWREWPGWIGDASRLKTAGSESGTGSTGESLPLP